MTSFTPSLDTVACPTCKRIGTLELSFKIVAQPYGSYSIAGMQNKIVAEKTPELHCTADGCDFSELAKRA